MGLTPPAEPTRARADRLAPVPERRWAHTVLLVGVSTSAVLTLAGTLLGVLASPPTLAGPARGAMPATGTVSGGRLSPISLIDAGLILLMLTPFARLVAILGEFLREGDRMYAGITVGVLAILGAGLLLGRAHG